MQTRKLWLAVSWLMIASLACNLTGPAPTPTPALTATPAISPTPRPPIAPRVIDYTPVRGDELRVQDSITIYFDNPMDRASAESAFKIEPAVTGDFVWMDDATMTFQPSTPLERAARYVVTVATTAKSRAGLALAKDLSFKADTVGFLEVTQAIPAPDTQEVPVDSVITVMFNRPVVPLTSLAQQATLPQPLTLEPAVAGTGEWLNTSIYVFRPTASLAGGVTYRASIAAGLEDTTGGLLKETFAWAFTAASPAIIAQTPAWGDGAVGLNTPISITFNQPMDHASTELAFALLGPEAGARPGVSGQFRWNTTSTEIGFYPAQRLQYDGTYSVLVDSTAQTATGAATLLNAYQNGFSTVPRPALVRTSPANGEQNAYYETGMNFYFSAPIDPRSLAGKFQISPAPQTTRVYTYWGSYDNSYYLGWDFAPSTDYVVTVAPGIADEYGTRIESEQTITFRTRAADPLAFFNAAGSMGTYSAYANTTVFVTTRNVNQVNFRLLRLTPAQLAGLSGNQSYEYREALANGDQDVIREWSLTTPVILNETVLNRVPLASEDGGTLPVGAYALVMEAPELAYNNFQYQFFTVSAANLTLKVAPTEALVWATDLNSGAPIANLPVEVYDEDFKFLVSGNTDANGLFRAAIPPQKNLWNGLFALSRNGVAPYEFSFVAGNWSNGLDPWEQGVASEYAPAEIKGYLYTDRPIYRPGQVVFFKGIVRNTADARYTLPAATQVRVRINNDQGEEIYNALHPLSAMGTFDGQVALATGAGLGYYSMNVMMEGLTDVYGNPLYLNGINFSVAAYRKPEFQVAVSSPVSEAAATGVLNATTTATFYFGGPVSNAQVDWTVLASDYAFQYTGEGYYDFFDYDYSSGEGFGFSSGGVLLETQGQTDGQGQATLAVPLDLSQKKYSQRLTLEAQVTDVNGQQVANNTEVIVHKGDYYVGARPQDYIGEAGKEVRFDVIVVDWDSQPVANQTVKAVFNDHQWNCAQETDPDTGETSWRCRAQDTLVAETTVTTDAQGKATVAFVPPTGGVYQLRATVTDRHGAALSTSTTMWVTDPGNYITWRQDDSATLDLIADRRSYQPGDTAEILIPSPFQGEATALVTIERGKIYQTEVLRLTSNSTVYRLPITADYAPGAFVSVVLVKGVDANNPVPAFKAGTIQLNVSPEQQALRLTLTPDQTQVGPGETVAYTIRATDYAGQPVQAEFSLALVDLAVLALAEPNSDPIMSNFYGNSYLSVRTALGLSIGVDRFTLEAEKAKGGGGGGGGDMGLVDVRSEFRDTAFWQATVATNAQGEARVEVKLPDNLTTWRLDARAVTANTLVGQATVDVVATKDLLIRPNTPRFFVVGDQAQVSAVINNNTANDLAGTVTLAATGVTLQTEAAQAVTIKAYDRVLVSWDLTVNDATTADLTFSVEAGGLRDSSKPTLGIPPDQRLPIYNFSALETTGTAGELETADSRLEALSLPRRFDATQGSLDLELSPSLAGSLTGALNYLEHFPYECTEQTVSRFLPNVLTYQALKALNLNDPALEQKLQTLVGDGLQRLYAQQHVDGGWGWWSTNESNPYISAYVAFGMLRAQQAGFNVNTTNQERAYTYLTQNLEVPAQVGNFDRWWLNRQAFTAYVLAEAGHADNSATVRLYEVHRAQLDTYARAYLALALAKSDPANADRVKTLLTEINNAAILSATGAHWEEDATDWWNMNTDTRSTAIVLEALTTLDPQNNLIPNVVRWLMTARTAQAWESTQETVWALIGLTHWMVVSGELQGNYEYSVALNDQLLHADVVTAENVRESVNLQVAVADLLKDEANRLLINRGGGAGRLYYTAHLNLFLPVESVTAVSRGVLVSRQYSIRRADCGGPDQPTCPPVTEAQVGDEIQVKVTLIAPHDLYYLVLEDPFPAGAEPVDTSLKTTSIVGQAPELSWKDPYYYGWGWWWFSNTDLRDEKLVLFADYLPKGTYEYTYSLHAAFPGTYKVIPTQAHEFYFPEVFGHGDGVVFTIKP